MCLAYFIEIVLQWKVQLKSHVNSLRFFFSSNHLSFLWQYNQWICVTFKGRAQNIPAESPAAAAQSQVSERLSPAGNQHVPGIASVWLTMLNPRLVLFVRLLQLAYCVVQFLEKDSTLTEPVRCLGFSTSLRSLEAL